MSWSTYATAQPNVPINVAEMIRVMQHMDECKRAADESRDASFAKLREQGVYVKVERDEHGEFWVVDDKVLTQFPRKTPGSDREFWNSMSGVRVVPLSEWLAQTLPK